MMLLVNRWLGWALSGWLVLIVVLLPTAAGAQNRWTQYTNVTSISAIAEGGHYLWVGTQGGLVRLDKTTGEKAYFDRFNSTLADSRILQMDSDAKGRLAAITRMGVLVELDGATWLNAGASAPFQGQYPFDLAWNAEGVLFVLTFDRLTRQPALFIRRSGQWTRVSLDGAGTVNASGSSVYGLMHQGVFGPYGSLIPYLQVDEQGKALVLTAGYNWMKLFRIDADGAVDTLAVPDHLGPKLYIQPKSGSPYWLCDQVLAKPNSDGWDTIPLPAGVKGYGQAKTHPRNLFARMPDGTEYWAFGRLYANSNGTWTEKSIPGDLNPYLPLQILALEKGNAVSAATPSLFAARGDWIGTLLGQDWTITDISRKPLGVGPDFFHTIFPRGTGSAEIVLARETGVEVFNPQSFKSTPVKLGNAWGTPPPAIYSIADAPDGKLWAMTTVGPIRFDLAGPQAPISANSLWQMPSYMRSGSGYFATDNTGTFWAADKGRLIAIPGGNADSSTWKSHWLPGARDRGADVFSLATHPDGSIWFATYVGSNPDDPALMQLGRYDGRAWRMFNATHHPWIGRITMPPIHSDRVGNVWVRFPDGLLQWDGSIWKEHAWEGSAHFPNGISALTVDPNGRLWAATTQPDAMLLRREGQWKPVAESQQILTASQIQSMAFDKSGRLWMTTLLDGVLVYDPGASSTTQIHPIRSAPGLSIQSARMQRRGATWTWGLGLTPTGDTRFFDLRGREIGLKIKP
jgi:hypothetical protein